MTIIVGYADGERVWMASDSLLTFGTQAHPEPVRKILRRPVGRSGDALIAMSGGCPRKGWC